MSQKSIPTLFFLLSAIAIGCSSDGPTSPETNGGTGYVLEETATIGVGGGSLQIDDFLLTVPAGAFTGDADIELYASTEDRPFGSHTVTRTFELRGFPEDLAAPVRVAIRYQGELEGSSFIAMGEPGSTVLPPDPVTVHHSLAASDSMGYLVCHLPPNESPARSRELPLAKAREPWTVYLSGSSLYETFDPNDPHFIIKYPLDLLLHMGDLKTHLHASLATITEDLQFSLADAVWEWPIEIMVKPHDQKFDGRLASVYGAINLRTGTPSLTVHSGHLRDESRWRDIQIRLSRSLLLLAMLVKDPKPNIARPSHAWLHQAILGWSEELFVGGDAFRPRDFPGHELEPFYGLRAGTEGSLADAEYHGRGISPLIKYLWDSGRLDAAALQGLYHGISLGQDPGEALLSNVIGPVETWWPGFFRAYVSGDLYGVSSDRILGMLYYGGTWIIDGPEDIEQSYVTGTVTQYTDCSAKVFKVDPSWIGIDPAAQIEFRVSSDEIVDHLLTAVVFQYDGVNLEYLGHARELRVADIYELYAMNHELVAVVVNSHAAPPFTGSSNVYLDIELIQPDPVEFVDVDVKIWSLQRQEYTNPQSEPLEWEDFVRMRAYRAGSFTSENVFEATWYDDTSNPGMITQGTITVILDPTRDFVERLDFYARTDIPEPINYVAIERCSVFHIPRFGDRYQILGTDAIGQLSQWEATVDDDGGHRELLFPMQNPENLISVSFH